MDTTQTNQPGATDLGLTMVPAKALKIQSKWEDASWDRHGAGSPSGSHFPSTMLSSGRELTGARVPKLCVPEDPASHLLDICNASLREDDIVVTSYPDSGGEYLVELLPWLLQQQSPSLNELYDPDICSSISSHPSRLKLLEHMSRCEIEAMTSPRVFLTHLWAAHFPSDVIQKRIKIIHVVRNPKDVATSLFHRLRRQGVFSFQQFLDLYLANQISTGHQMGFLRQLREFQYCYKDHPLLEIQYEDMVKKPIDVIQNLGYFLQVPVSGSLCDHILSSNGFLHSLGQADQSNQSGDGEHGHVAGAVGDWKNTFNMAQNETFNFFLFQTQRDLNINFCYD